MENSYSKIFKAISLFGSVQGLNILLNLVRTMIAARLIGPTGMLIVSNYNETKELIHTTTNLGLDTAGIRGISSAYEQWHKAEASERNRLRQQMDKQVLLFRSWVLLLALLGTVVCFALSAPLSLFTFHDYNHVWGYMLLSPAVGLATLTCGEMVVLKAIRKLRAIAIISVIDVAITILVSTPIYLVYHTNGIIFTLVLMSIVQMLIVCIYSYKAYPLKFCFKRNLLKEGFPMIVLGISFALSGAVGHLSQLGINSYITSVGGDDVAGLFRSVYSIVMVYAAGIIFASLDSDFFPRLAGAFSNTQERRDIIWKQIKLTVLLVIPVIIAFELLLPWIISFVYGSQFESIILPARIACLALLFRAVYLPIAYAPLAAGDSKTFLALECVSYSILTGGVILGYCLYGMEGAGAGLILSNAADMIITYIVAKIKYKI